MSFKPIEGWEQYYAINPEGEVLSHGVPNTRYKEPRKLKHVLDKGIGYYIVTLARKGVGRRNYFIHRLLATHFLPNPENKAHVNHIDGDKTNNSLSNLEWATPQENSQHAYRTGLSTSDATDVAVVQVDLATGQVLHEFKSIHEAGRNTGVQWQNIWKVCNGRRRSAGGYSWAYAKDVE
jgi:hypothetical protein